MATFHAFPRQQKRFGKNLFHLECDWKSDSVLWFNSAEPSPVANSDCEINLEDVANMEAMTWSYIWTPHSGPFGVFLSNFHSSDQ